MKYLCALMLAIMLTGCATTHKVSLHELREYDQAIQIAERQGIDTTAMHKTLVDMFMSYLKDPGQDPYLKAAQDSADAMQWGAVAATMQAFKPIPVYDPGPMSPPQFYNMSSQWFHLPGAKR